MGTTATTLDEAIRDLAARGEISHISLTPTVSGAWCGSFSMCSKFGVSIANDPDPVKALLLACTTAKMKTRPMMKVDGRLKESVDTIPQPVVEVVPDDVEDLM